MAPSCTSIDNLNAWKHLSKPFIRPGWPVFRKLWHMETTPFKKFMTNLRKWKKLTLVPRFPTSTVKPKATETKHKCSFVREVCVVFFPTWSLMQLPTQFLEFWWFRMLSWVRSFLATSGNVYDNSRLSDDIHRGSRQIHVKWLRFTCPSCTWSQNGLAMKTSVELLKKLFTLVLYEVVIEISTALHSVGICICKTRHKNRTLAFSMKLSLFTIDLSSHVTKHLTN